MNKYLKGLFLAIGISTIAYLLSIYVILGPVTIAIIIGIMVGNLTKIDESYNHGITYAEKTLLAYAIALMGVNLNFTILNSLGIKTLFLIITGMIVTIYSAILLGKFYKVDTKLALLLGIGNGVCGSSAISATAPIIKTDKHFIGISIAIVNLLGTLGIFLLPFIAISFHLSDIDAGILIGNTLQAVGQVTAAGFSISDTTGVSATTVKMGRILLLTPLVFILIYLHHKKGVEENTQGAKVPGFIIFFILLSILNSLSFISEDIKNIIATLSHTLLVIAMSAIGLKIHFNSIKSEGKIALKIASLVFLIQIIFTLIFLI